MKVFSVSNVCNACGECVVQTDLLTEDNNGFAVPAVGCYIKESDLPQAELLASQCPVGALTIVEQSSVTSTGMSGLQELAQILEQQLKAVHISDVVEEGIHFEAKDYRVDYGYISGEGIASYSSSGQAKNAGKEQFNRVFWDRRKDLVISILTQYKVKMMRKYYDFSVPEETIYAKYGCEFETILKRIKAEAFALAGKLVPLPDSFTTFKPELDKWFRDHAKEQYDTVVYSSYIKEFCENLERISGCRKRDYEELIWAEENVDIVGTDRSGNNKIKTTYSFHDASYAGKSMVDDILLYINWEDKIGLRSIDDICKDHLDYLMGEYRRLVQNEIEKKVKEFKAAINNL